MLYGILIGQPLSTDEVRRHVIDNDPAPNLPHVTEPGTVRPVMLTSLRLGPGCYGLADGATFEFGESLTLIYGENGTGKSSLARILRAMAGRPSAQRPPHNMFTGNLAAATLTVKRDGAAEEHRWRGEDRAPVVHVDVFDSADTRIDGIEYQVRPRSVLALEELRIAVDGLQLTAEPLHLPTTLHEALTDDELRMLSDPEMGRDVLLGWLAEVTKRGATEVQGELDELGDEAIAQRRTAIERNGRIASADTSLADTLYDLDLQGFANRLAAAAESAVDLHEARPPIEIAQETWLAFCVRRSHFSRLQGGDASSATATLLKSMQVSLLPFAPYLPTNILFRRRLIRAVTGIQQALHTHSVATGGATSQIRQLATELLDALGAHDVAQLRSAEAHMRQIAASDRDRLKIARAEWTSSSALLATAGARRLELQRELTVARRCAALAKNPQAVADLVEQMQRRDRLAAAARTQGTKMRINTALKRHTEYALESAYGAALVGRLERFTVPHVDLLTARYAARGGQARRRFVVGKVSTDDLFSEGEQRALALADLAAELDVRSEARHPVVIDDPVSSLDYRRLESVVEFIKDLIRQGRQVIVLTHSLWLAAELLKGRQTQERRNRSRPSLETFGISRSSR